MHDRIQLGESIIYQLYTSPPFGIVVNVLYGSVEITVINPYGK
jgi:hypothetical protein